MRRSYGFRTFRVLELVVSLTLPAAGANSNPQILLRSHKRLLRGICGSGFKEPMQLAAGSIEGTLLSGQSHREWQDHRECERTA
jgi:hypothetical protein